MNKLGELIAASEAYCKVNDLMNAEVSRVSAAFRPTLDTLRDTKNKLIKEVFTPDIFIKIIQKFSPEELELRGKTREEILEHVCDPTVSHPSHSMTLRRRDGKPHHIEVWMTLTGNHKWHYDVCDAVDDNELDVDFSVSIEDFKSLFEEETQ